MNQVTVISGVDRRRAWSDEQKQALVAAAFGPGARVSEVAARADIRTSQLYRWRRTLAAAASAAGFAPVVVTTTGNRPDEPLARCVKAPVEGTVQPSLVIEIDGAVVQAMADTPPALMTATLKALRR
jgi:transposase